MITYKDNKKKIYGVVQKWLPFQSSDQGDF